MIKEENLGDTNKLYLTLHEADGILLEKCKMEWKARSVYRVENKEQGRKKQNIWLTEAI